MNEHQGFARTFFSLGFRPFFLGAMVVAVVFMAIWMGAWAFHWPMAFAVLSPIQWHAHEMIYGYGMAVIAGFLLTAIKNWTGRIGLPNGFPEASPRTRPPMIRS